MSGGLKIFYLVLAANHNRHGGRLHPAHVHHIVVARFPRTNGVAPCQIHADQPIGITSAPRRIIQPAEFAIVPQIVQRLFHALIVERVQKQTQNRFFVADKLQHLVHQKLSFAIRVAGVDNRRRLLRQKFYHVELPLR